MHFKQLSALLLIAASVAATAAAQVSPSPLHSLFAPISTAQAQAQQGISVAIDGNLAVVGAPTDDLGAGDSGVAKVYDVTSGALLHTLVNPTPAGNDWFGQAVAISGTRVIVGAPMDNALGFDSGIAYVYDLAGATPTVPVMILNNPAGKGDDWFGYSLAASGSLVAIGAYLDDTGTNSAGSVHIYNLDASNAAVPFLTLTNPSPGRGDSFGFAVGISGTRVAAGAQFDDSLVQDAGIAYVFDLASTNPQVPVVTLANPSPAAFEYFGLTIAISGTRVLVGAPFAHDSTTNSGAAYVYDLASPSPSTPVAILTNSTPGVDDNFGVGLAISGTRVIVSAYQDDTAGANAGISYVYDLASGTPAVPAFVLNKPPPVAGAGFGYAAAVSGSRVIIGAPSDNAAAAGAGGAYVYDLASGTPSTPVATLAHPSPVLGDNFGFAVAASGSRVLVGAFREDSGAFDAGSAYLYDLTNGTPTAPILALRNPSPGFQDQFGQAVAMSGTRCVIGAPHDDTGAISAGSAYVYDFASGSPTVPVAVLTNPVPTAYSYFGSAVGLDGRYAVASAYQDDTGANAAGSAYVYDLLSATPAKPFVTLTNPHPVQYGYFGHSVAISGTHVVIVGYRADAGAPDVGAAYVYDLSNAMPAVPIITLTNPAPSPYGIGNAVAISGSRILVAVEGSDIGASGAGTVYVYDLMSATPTAPVLTLTNPSPATFGIFGYALAVSGARVVVGSYGDDIGADRSGVAYVYDLDGVNPGAPVATLFNPTPAAQDYFGVSVAIDGATVVVGAHGDDTNAGDRGAAYIFGVGPKLRIAAGSFGQATLSWTPTNSPGFALQFADAPTPTNWINAPSGFTNPVTISLTNASRFYRVARP